MTVAKKIIAGYLFVILFLCFTIGGSFYGMSQMQKQTDMIVKDAIPLGNAASNLLTALINEETGVRGYLVSGDENYLEPYNIGKNMIEEELEVINSLLNGHPIMEELINEAVPKINAIQDYFGSQIELVKNGKIEEARAKVGEGKLLFDSFRETNVKIENDIKKLTNDSWNTSKNEKENARSVIIIIGFIAIIGTIISTFILVKMISKPVVVVSNALERLAEGDLTIEEIKVRSKDEIGTLAQALNKTVFNLRGLIKKLSDASMMIASSSEELTASAEQSANAAGQVASSTQETASGAEEQTKDVEKVTNSISKITSDINKMNDNSKEMLQLSLNASDASVHGTQLLNEVVDEMNGINSSVQETSQVIQNLFQKSQEVGSIIGIITDITSQTNLLALNAAIEAARAGETGKGFAVVAEEVRKLAEDSRVSAEKITSLVNDIQVGVSQAVVSMQKESEKVISGLDRTYKVNESLKTIEKDILNVTERVQGVSSSLDQINSSSNEIIKLVKTVGENAVVVSQLSVDNSASVEEQLATMEDISGSAQSLSILAEDLGLLMTQFKL